MSSDDGYLLPHEMLQPWFIQGYVIMCMCENYQIYVISLYLDVCNVLFLPWTRYANFAYTLIITLIIFIVYADYNYGEFLIWKLKIILKEFWSQLSDQGLPTLCYPICKYKSWMVYYMNYFFLLLTMPHLLWTWNKNQELKVSIVLIEIISAFLPYKVYNSQFSNTLNLTRLNIIYTPSLLTMLRPLRLPLNTLVA